MRPPMMILLEFNELCPSLLRRFMDRGMIPNFRRLYESSAIFTTDAGEEPPNLEPWIQWPTLHTGVPFAEHGAFHLGDGRSIRQEGIAEALSDAGVRVGVLGSMNMNYGPLNGYMIPDPWDQQGEAHPAWLGTFYRTVSHHVQEASREDAGGKGEMLRFGLFLARNGLSLATARRILAQLLEERRDPGVKWRRASLLEHMQYDLARNLNRRFRIQFATFFANSTAHYQHYHWRNMEPEKFAVPPPATDHPSLSGAIEYGYRSMDRLVGRFLDDYPDAVLVLCTALSQQPWVETTKCTYRPRRFEDLLAFAGIPTDGANVKPVMAEEFRLECRDEAGAESAEARLRGLHLDDGRPAMKVERKGQKLLAGCAINDASAVGRPLRRGDGQSRPFDELFYMIHSMRSGRHHPDGVLWIRTGQHRVVEEKVSLTDIAPTVLAHFGLGQPEFMEGQPLPVGELARFPA
jgi:hypothetical protein